MIFFIKQNLFKSSQKIQYSQLITYRNERISPGSIICNGTAILVKHNIMHHRVYIPTKALGNAVINLQVES